MKRKIIYLSLLIVIIATLCFTPGCSGISGLTGSSTVGNSEKIARQAQLADKWMMKQIQFNIAAGDEAEILLKLADKDQVEGYFYLEDENGIEFQIMADTLVYESKSDNPKAPSKVSSDRFTFTATKALGSTYSLIFRNTDDASKKTKMSVFTEIIYPVTGSMFVPVNEPESE